MSTILPGNQESATLALDGGVYGLLARRRELMERIDPSLIAYWDGADAAVSKNWIDRIGGKRWNIYDRYTKGTNYYQFDNVANDKQFATLTDNDFDVDYEIKVVVDFELNPDGIKDMIVIDFGGYGETPSGHWGMYSLNKANGAWYFRAKYNGNNPQTTTASGTFPVLEAGTWTPCIIEFGIEHNKSTDKQRAYMKVGEGMITSGWLDKMKIASFIAAFNNARLATTCYGIGTTVFSRSRIRYKTIKVYNKV